jgi:uncharacterized protein
MSGERDLAVLLATMEPVLWDMPFAYGRLPEGHPPLPDAFAVIREAEGLSVIAPSDSLAARDIPFDGHWARISLRVHSALEAVGLTAAVAGALTREGISANAVAGFFHDHFFVQWDRRDAAMAALRHLTVARPA